MARRVDDAFRAAGLEYRIVGGLAACLCVEEVDPDAGRLTKDIDIALRREDLEAITRAAGAVGFGYEHVDGVDMFVQSNTPSARGAVHVVFAGEKVRATYLEAVPALAEESLVSRLPLIPIDGLVRLKLASFARRIGLT